MTKASKIQVILAAVALFSASWVLKADAKEIVTGMYGLWASDNIEQSLQVLSQSKFKVITGLEGRYYLDLCNKYGLKCLVGFRSGLTKEIAQNETSWRNYLSSLRAYITDLKAHPAVYAWYPIDEPDLSGIPVEKIKALVATIKEVDNVHPIYTVIYGNPGVYRKYLPFFDIIGIEPYLGASDTKIDVVGSKIKVIYRDLKLLKLNKKVFVTLGAFELKPRNSQSKITVRKPTPDEYNEMVRVCKSFNVDGVMVYTLALKNNQTFVDWNLSVQDVNLWKAVLLMPSQL